MLYLQFCIEEDRYIISASRILSIIPLVTIHKMIGVPDYMAGFINHKGQTIPIVDLRKLLAGTKSKTRLSTRIVLVDFLQEGKQHKTLGLIAEKATEVVKLSEEDFSPKAIHSDSASYLDSIANDSDGMLQKINIDELINLKVRAYLDFQVA
jgi:chemotaxis-related protein WspB